MSLDSNPTTASEIAALRSQVFSLLIALIVVSGTVTAYLYRQSSLAGRDLTALEPQADQLINGFNQTQPAVAGFINELVAYGEKHPDFRPVLQKYGIAPVPGVPAGSPPPAIKK
jgi:hypothetical protein